MSKDVYEAEKDRIEREYKAEEERCESGSWLRGGQRKV